MISIQHAAGYAAALFRNRRGTVGLPRFLTYTVTFGCNARCIMCDSWKMTTKGDLTAYEYALICRQLPQMDAVRLTGGEPFARQDMVELAEITCRYLNPMVLHVTTNGFLTDRIVQFCEQRPQRVPLELLISVDGVGEKHNQIRGNSNAYKFCMETITALAPLRKKLSLRIAVNQTIVDAEGIEHYRMLRDELKKYDVQNHVVMAYDMSATYNLEREVDVAPTEVGQFTTFGEFTNAQIEQLLNDVEADLFQLPFAQRLAKRYYINGIRNRLLKQQGSPNPRCVALNAHLRLFPNGDVPTCQFNSKVIGNLKQQSFQEIWASAQAEEQRKWVSGCPGCWAECEVLPSAIYTGDLLTAWAR